MRAFVEIVDHGSLTAAGKALNKSLPTMVRTLADLERDLGVVLLRRTTRRMSLTEEGRVYLERARSILADVAETEELVRLGKGTPRGRLRVTAPVQFGRMHVTPAVTTFLQGYPSVQVELLLLDRVVDLVQEGLDVAVRIGPLGDSGLVATRVGRMRRVVCASPAWLREHGSPEHPRDLAEVPCVGFTGLGFAEMGALWRFRDGDRDLSQRIRGRFSVNDVAAAIEVCVAGLGLGSFLEYQVAPAIRDGLLQVVLAAYEPAPLPVSLVYADARLMSPRLRAFLDVAKKQLRSATWQL